MCYVAVSWFLGNVLTKLTAFQLTAFNHNKLNYNIVNTDHT